MNIEEFRAYCLSKKFVMEDFPFGIDTLVFKVKGKIFAIAGLNDDSLKVNHKCDPERALELRDEYAEIKPGYHMNKKHWNTIEFESRLSSKLLKELIDHSYDLVVLSLPLKDRF
jgi:predicted DNA-binding protein (MmcQ/YjbR family)